jgi:hypothetical protein
MRFNNISTKGAETVDGGLIVTLLVIGLGGATVAFRFFYKRTKKTNIKTVQKNNVVGRDQAGRDIIKKFEHK